MILDHATALARDAAAVRERNELGLQRAAWQTHAKRFSEVRERLATAVQFLGWLSKTGQAERPASDAPALAAALGSVTLLLDALRAEPASVLEGNQAPDTASQVEAVVRTIEEQARTAWSDHLAGDGWVPASLWAPFENSSYGAAVREAVQQDRRHRELARPAFPTPAEQVAYEQLTKDRAALVAKLPDTSDEEISAFLIAAAGSGVSLDRYTAAVAAWLAEYGLTDRYVIRTRT
jgi:hypothetical protein